MFHVLVIAMLGIGLNLADVQIDGDRLEHETSVDADVIEGLRNDGDVASIARPVNLHFVGTKSNLERLANDLQAGDWRVIEIYPYQESYAIDIRIEMTTDAQAIRQLTETSLRIEKAYEIRSDGWGTLATSARIQ